MVSTAKVNNWINDNFYFVIVMFALVVASVVLVTIVPQLPGIPQLEKTFWLFGLAFDTVILIGIISGLLISKWYNDGRKNNVPLVWASAFLLFSVPFIGMMLNSVGVPWANDHDPFIFFMFRQTMILFVAGMYFGIAKILSKNRAIRVLPTMAITLGGYLWFIYGLLIVKSIEYTMYGFLYGCFVPVSAIIAYSFYLYRRDFKLVFPGWLAVGFAYLGVTYMAWAPWHKVDTYILWFFQFILAMAIIMTGFAMMQAELRKSKK